MTGRPKKPKQKAPTWGGKRTASPGKKLGRPLQRGGKAKVLITVRLTEEERECLMKFSLEGENHNQTAKRLLLEFAEV